MEEQVEWETNLSTSSKYAGLGAAMGPVGLGSLRNLLAAELMIGFGLELESS